MTAPAFGFVPLKRNIVLSDGADFILNLVLEAGATWPPNTLLYIDLGAYTTTGPDHPRRWVADVNDGVASWKVESDVTDLVPDGTSYRMYVQYPDDIPRESGPQTTDLLWFLGKVKRTRA